VYTTGPSATRSFTPVTVTVCQLLQLAEVNVNDAGLTVPSSVLLDERSIVTSLAGWLVSLTVKVAVPPTSEVTRNAVGVTVTPAVSVVGVGH